jgi:hypothetical protein
MNRRGRPTKINAALTKRVCAFLTQGVDQKTACNLACIPYSTYNEWKARGEAEKEPYASFFSVISRARDKHELRLLKVINDAAEGTLPRHADWKAASWQLERGWPKKYAPFDRRPIPVEDDVGKPKRFDVAIVCNTGGKSLEQLLDFPVAPDSASARAPEDKGNEPEMRYNVFTRAFEPIEEITDDQS